MSFIKKIISQLEFNSSNPQEQAVLNRERHDVMTRQAPLMYATLIINMFTLTFPYWEQLSPFLSWIFPCLLSAIFIRNAIQEYKNRNRYFSDRDIIKKFRTATKDCAVFGVVLLIWAYSLFSYDNPVMQIHIAFFLFISLAICAYFLMYILSAVVVLSVVIMVPSTIYLLLIGNASLSALAINCLFINIAVTSILYSHYNNFTDLVKQRAKLTTQKSELLQQADKLEKMNGQNLQLANIDTLTDLPNRRSFFAQLDQLTSSDDGKKPQKLMVGLLDLDGFKRINDVFGHPVGDALLQKSAGRILDIVGHKISLSRLGGDEFGLIITQSQDVENVLGIGNKICDAMRQMFHLREGSIQIAATIGFVEFPSMASTGRLAFERADYALCHSKQYSKGKPVVFSTEHETIIRRVSTIEHQLRTSDLEQELSLMFQPIVDTKLQKTVGFEALARWNNSNLGLVRPDVFIRAAEQIGMIGTLTNILLRKALDAAKHWPEDIKLSFNLSIYDLSSPQTILGLVSIVEKSSFPSHRIIFEITETAMMHDFKQTSEALNLLKLQGAKIALDDFGTGYSSLSYVQRMPLDRLKIDRSFITDIARDKNTRNIVKTILDLCNNLKLECVVEGVENRQQLDCLHQMGCQYIQGYYFSPPLTSSEADEYIAQQNNIKQRLAS